MNEVGYMGGFPRRGARRPWVIPVAVVVALSLLGLPSAPVEAQPPSGTPSVQRVAGGDRVATAAAVSAAHWSSAEDALLATAGNYPDALAAGTLAAALDAPLLLTGTDSLAPAAAAELQRLSVERVHLMGGPAAISPAVEDALVEEGYAVHRIAGIDRHRTAAAVAREAGPAASGDVVLALGGHADPTRAWPDALSAGGLAATADRPPLLLTDGESLPAVTEEALSELSGGEDRRVLLAGGTSAIGASVEARLEELGHTVVRLAGGSRFETSTRVADAVLRRMSSDPRPLVIASGANFPDGLAAAALAARVDGVVLLVPPADLATGGDLRAWLQAQSPRFDRVIVVGGASAVSDQVASEVAAALTGPSVPLPAALPQPVGTPEEIARQLVQAIGQRPGFDEDRSADARAAMLTALGYAGLTVLQSDGSAAITPDQARDQGMAIEAWEAYALAETARDQRQDDLHGVAADVTTLLDDLQGAPVEQFILDGIRAAATDASHRLHGWAWLLVESGRQAPIPHDLLIDAPSAIQLTQLQHALIIHRITGDVMALVHEQDPSLTTGSQGRTTRQAASGASRPCTTSEVEAKILDYTAIGITKAFDSLLEHLENQLVPNPDPNNPTTIERLTKWVSRADAAAAWTQIVATYMLLDVKLAWASGQDVIERTPEAAAGQQDTMITTVSMNTGDAQVINCIRIALNAIGLDFSLPEDGAVDDAQVDTILLNIPPFVPLKPQPGESSTGKMTDDGGRVFTHLEGKPRSRSLDPALAMEVRRLAPFEARVVLDPADIFDDFPDIIATALGGSPGAIAQSLMIDLATRTRWLGTRGWDLFVTDYEERCPETGQAFTQDPPPEEPPLVCGPGSLTGQIGYSWTVHTVPNDRGETHSGGAHVTVNANLVADGAQPGSYVDDGTSSYEVAMDWQTVTVSGECTDRVRYTGSGVGTFTEGEGIHYLHHDGQAEQDLFYVPVGHVTVTTTVTFEGPPQCSPGEFSYDEEHWLSLACPSPGFLFQDTDGLQGTASYDESGFTQLDLSCNVEVQDDTRREVKDVTGILHHGG